MRRREATRRASANGARWEAYRSTYSSSRARQTKGRSVAAKKAGTTALLGRAIGQTWVVMWDWVKDNPGDD